MSLEQSAAAVRRVMKQKYEEIIDKEEASIKVRMIGIDREPFSRLSGKISCLAIKLIWPEYLALPPA